MSGIVANITFSLLHVELIDIMANKDKLFIIPTSM